MFIHLLKNMCSVSNATETSISLKLQILKKSLKLISITGPSLAAKLLRLTLRGAKQGRDS